MHLKETLVRAVLVFLIKEENGHVLLPIKNHSIGRGRRNGYGGSIKPRETIEAATVRELMEEARVIAKPNAFQKIALLDCHTSDSQGRPLLCRVYVSCLRRWEHEPRETEEMKDLAWFDPNALPFDQMLPADREWLAPALDDQPVRVEVWYGAGEREPLRKTQVTRVSGAELNRLWSP